MNQIEEKHYVVAYRADEKERVLAELSAYAVRELSLLPMLTVRVPVAEEASLLEQLATMTGITFHEAAKRSILPSEKEVL